MVSSMVVRAARRGQRFGHRGVAASVLQRAPRHRQQLQAALRVQRGCGVSHINSSASPKSATATWSAGACTA
jgi:hypothetical protein